MSADDLPESAEKLPASLYEIFNPLTDDLNDLWLDHADCWFFPQIKLEMDSLIDLVQRARDNVLDLINTPEWALKAGEGIFRCNGAIHQHVTRYGNFAETARALGNCLIPREPPTLMDEHIYALLSICEARLSAEAYCELAAGYESELEATGIQPDDDEDILCLRQVKSAWERDLWRWADREKALAEKFLLMADFAFRAPDPTHVKHTEAQLVVLSRRLTAVEAVAKPYRQGRPKGALSPISLALMEIVRDARSRELDDVLEQIREYLGEDIQGVIRFDEIEEDTLYYTVITKAQPKQMSLDSLRRRLKNLPDF